MAKPFSELREGLLRAGVTPRHVRRYLTELADHLNDLKAEEERAGHSPAAAESAACILLGGTDELAKAMIEQRQFQLWCVRAPLAMFGVAPVLLLAGAYLIACLILWSWWKIFLPGIEAPFAHLNRLAIFYLGVGWLLYFGAPIFVGWGIGFIAVRQRLKTVWPFVGLILITLIGCVAQVRVRRPVVPGGAGHVSMVFSPGLSVESGLLYGLWILSLMVTPFLFWRLENGTLLSNLANLVASTHGQKD
jgi:hypothetical protein